VSNAKLEATYYPVPRPDVHLGQQPEIDIEPAGLRGFYVSITHGMMRYGPDGGSWFRWTLRGAQRKGDRELAKYKRREARKTGWAERALTDQDRWDQDFVRLIEQAQTGRRRR
jgi:hypothetical protein